MGWSTGEEVVGEDLYPTAWREAENVGFDYRHDDYSSVYYWDNSSIKLGWMLAPILPHKIEFKDGIKDR